MKKFPEEKITFRIKSIREPLKKKIEETGDSPSRYLTRLVCCDLGIDVPKDGRFKEDQKPTF